MISLLPLRKRPEKRKQSIWRKDSRLAIEDRLHLEARRGFVLLSENLASNPGKDAPQPELRTST